MPVYLLSSHTFDVRPGDIVGFFAPHPFAVPPHRGWRFVSHVGISLSEDSYPSSDGPGPYAHLHRFDRASIARARGGFQLVARPEWADLATGRRVRQRADFLRSRTRLVRYSVCGVSAAEWRLDGDSIARGAMSCVGFVLCCYESAEDRPSSSGSTGGRAVRLLDPDLHSGRYPAISFDDARTLYDLSEPQALSAGLRVGDNRVVLPGYLIHACASGILPHLPSTLAEACYPPAAREGWIRRTARKARRWLRIFL